MSEHKKSILRKLEPVIFLLVFFAFFGGLGYFMGAKNMISTLMNTAHDLLINTCFYLMAVCVLSGAISELLINFGVISLLEKILRPLMQPIFNLPGAAALGGVMTFFSDNPSIIALAEDRSFARYFKKYQIVSLANFGTAFGMGLIVVTFMASQSGNNFGIATTVGFFGACFGAVISTRLMQRFIRKSVGEDPAVTPEEIAELEKEPEEDLSVPDEMKPSAAANLATRILNDILDGGRKGVMIGLAIIPGVIIICSLVMILTFGPSPEGYTGGIREGVGFIPWFFSFFQTPIHYLFGFTDPKSISFPLTAMGSVGSALGLVKTLKPTANDIAVFTAMGMCWSGFLATHTAMLDELGYRHLISKAVTAHFIGGFCAGIFAHYVFLLVAKFL